MKRCSYLALFFLATIISLQAKSLDDLVGQLDSISEFNADVRYTVLLPMATDDIVYSVRLLSDPVSDDRLSPCNYILEWSLLSSEINSEGFNAYFDGNHYRYRDQRLQEYHFEADSLPFLSPKTAVQRTAQFADLLPQFIAESVRLIASDSAYTWQYTPDTLNGDRRVDLLTAKESRQGLVAREITYVFDSATGRPIHFESEYNPGAISEQAVSADYTYPGSLQPVENYSEQSLINAYPEQFERFRSSNFRVENLPGTHLPSFSLPTLGGDRLSHNRGEGLSLPAVFVYLDPEVATSPATVRDIRKAVSRLPFSVDIVWLFNTNHSEQPQSIIGEKPIYGETALMSSRSLLRDLGITVAPTILFIDRDAVIRDIQLGYTENLPNLLLNKLTFYLH